LVPEEGLEPSRGLTPPDFQSAERQNSEELSRPMPQKSRAFSGGSSS